MTERSEPNLTGRATADLAARREREAEALRANLRRRKEQQRAVVEAEQPSATSRSSPVSGLPTPAGNRT
jgi:hypothetical protein